MINKLIEMGIRPCIQNDVKFGTFYIWASIENLPSQINDGFEFFKEALKYNVLTVPGIFFDVNPGIPVKQRLGSSPFIHFVRFSFGPSMDNMLMGLERLKKMVSSFKTI